MNSLNNEQTSNNEQKPHPEQDKINDYIAQGLARVPSDFNLPENIQSDLRADFIVVAQDAYGDGWNGSTLNIGDNVFGLDDGSYAEYALSLDDGNHKR